MPELVKSADVTEQLKASDPMKWVGRMNALKAQTEEIILSDIHNNWWERFIKTLPPIVDIDFK